MKVKEIIKAIEENKVKDQNLMFIDETQGRIFFPQVILNNSVEIALNEEKREDNFLFATIKLSDFLDHLKNNANEKQSFYVSNADYYITSFNNENEEGCFFYIDKI
jgi:hypothetical protein